MEATPIAWGEAWTQEEMARTKLHSMAAQKFGGGLVGGMAPTAISAWALAGRSVMGGMQMGGGRAI